jgi:uncharacterized protein (DUF1330 family)
MHKTSIAIVMLLGFVVVAWAGAVQDVGKKGYLVAQIDVTNAQQYSEYTKVTPALIEKFGGRFLARGGRAVTLEGPPARGRVVVIEFPSFERAQEFYASPEYQAAMKLRAGAATAQFVVVEGW